MNPNTEILPEETPIEQPTVDPLYNELFDYNTCIGGIKQLISQFDCDVRESEQRRKERYADIDPEQLRQRGELKDDETLIADRLIDGNIMRDLPDKMGFLYNGGKLGDFDCLSQPDRPSEKIAIDFTKGLTYNGWLKEWYRIADGGELHGRDYLELVFDTTKPLHVGFEHIGFEKLYFNRKVDNIQDSERLIRRYDMSFFKLKQMGKWKTEVIDELGQKYKEARRDENLKVYKVFTKYNGCVYVCWFCEETGVSDWLSGPEKLYLGVDIEAPNPAYIDAMQNSQSAMLIQMGVAEMPQEYIQQPVEIDFYPVFTYVYREDEQECLVDKKGRGFLDFPMQEANTAIISGFVNAVIRASNVYASPGQDGDSDGGDIKQLDTILEHGRIYNRPLNFWGTDMPDVTVLQGIQFLQTMNAQSAGKFSFATNNRKDSRKTAKELGIAEQQEQKATTNDLATFSEFVRAVLSAAWLVVQNRAKQGKLQFCLIEVPNQDGSVAYVNDLESINQLYDIRPAGEAAIEQEKEVMKMMQDWPVIQTTALAPTFLEEYIKIRYPEKADKYTMILRQGDVGKQLVAAMGTVLQSALSPQDIAALTPEELQQLHQLKQQADAYIGQTNENGKLQATSGQGQAATPTQS